MIRVYCAGKIAQNDWRHTLFPGLANAQVEYVDGKLTMDDCPPRRGTFSYAGPYFCGTAGHGLSHGEHSHGLRELERWQPDGDHGGTVVFPRREISALCLGWLKAADVVFAWIEDLAAYATLAEIGYAVALQKPVFCFWPPALEPLDDWWFVQTLVKEAQWEPSVEVAWGRFSQLAEAHLYTIRLRRMPYDQYLQTTHWRELRLRKLNETGRHCQLCNSDDRPEVHHRTYERRGEELLSDLTVLCKSCHSKFHGKAHVERVDKPKPNVGRYPLQ